jgi:hypothetical protein
MRARSFNGAIDMPPKIAATYELGGSYVLEVKDHGRVVASPYYRRRLRNGKVRVFFRTRSELPAVATRHRSDLSSE